MHVPSENKTIINMSDAVPQSWRAMIALFTIMLMAAWWGFGHSAYAVFMIIICLFYGAMYFGMPWLMFRMRAKFLTQHKIKAIPRERMSGLDTWTGWSKNQDAILQILTVPADLALAMIAIAIVNSCVRPG